MAVFPVGAVWRELVSDASLICLLLLLCGLCLRDHLLDLLDGEALGDCLGDRARPLAFVGMLDHLAPLAHLPGNVVLAGSERLEDRGIESVLFDLFVELVPYVGLNLAKGDFPAK